MFDKQVTALTAILKDKDIREYSGDAFWNRIKAVVSVYARQLTVIAAERSLHMRIDLSGMKFATLCAME